MGLFSRRDRGTIVASAARIEPREPKKPEDPTTKAEEWQKRAFDMRDALPEPRYAERYMGNAFSRMRIFPGIIPAVGEDPVELDPKGNPELDYGEAEAAIALDLVDRLRSPQGGIREIQRRIGAHLTIAGECLLCGRPSEDPGFAGTERWDIYSTEELVRTEEGVGEKASQWVLKPPTGFGGTTIELPRGEVVVVRIMLPHPRFSAWADSPMRAGLGILEELLTLTKAIQAVAYSRISGAGLLLLPKSMLTAQVEAQPDDDGQAKVKYPLAQEIIDVMAAAKTDPGNAAAQVPVMAWVPDELYEQIGSDKLIQWSHDLDTIMAAQREELIRRFAIAIDLPADILTGKADINHWNAASVDDEAFRMHIEPLVILAVGGLTAGYFLPALRKAAVPMPERFALWYDPAELVVRPNRATDAKDAHERFLISDAKARADLGYDDEDAPEDEEVVRRIQIERARKAPAAALNGDGPPPAAEDAPEAQPSPNGTQAEGVELSFTASAESMLADAIGEIARTVLRDVQREADAVMRRGLEKANARLRSLAGRRDGDAFARDAVKGLTAESLQVVPTLGPTIVAKLANDEDVLAGAFDRLRDVWDERVARADAALVELMGGDDEAAAELDEARDLGWAALLAALTARAHTLLFTPDVLADAPGEVDGLLVQAGDVRDALVVAGGGGPEATDLTTGEIVERGFRRNGKALEGKRWVYGDPSLRRSMFAPHHRLDTKVFHGPQDPKLRNTSGWPPVDYYRPGDHKGCLCTTKPARVVSVQRGPVGSPDEIVIAGVG